MPQVTVSRLLRLEHSVPHSKSSFDYTLIPFLRHVEVYIFSPPIPVLIVDIRHLVVTEAIRYENEVMSFAPPAPNRPGHAVQLKCRPPYLPRACSRLWLSLLCRASPSASFFSGWLRWHLAQSAARLRVLEVDHPTSCCEARSSCARRTAHGSRWLIVRPFGD